MDIETTPTEELKAELKRREDLAKQAAMPTPTPSGKQDWSSVEAMVVDYVTQRTNSEYIGDLKGYIFEAAIEAVFGKTIWPYLRSLKQ